MWNFVPVSRIAPPQSGFVDDRQERQQGADGKETGSDAEAVGHWLIFRTKESVADCSNKNASEVYALGGASRYTIRLSTDGIGVSGGMGECRRWASRNEIGGRSEKYIWTALNLFATCVDPDQCGLSQNAPRARVNRRGVMRPSRSVTVAVAGSTVSTGLQEWRGRDDKLAQVAAVF
jgi:hypothetical protein